MTPRELDAALEAAGWVRTSGSIYYAWRSPYNGHLYCTGTAWELEQATGSKAKEIAKELNEEKAMTVKVAKPEWVAAAIKDSIGALKLIEDGKWPTVLIGFSLVTIARRLLRCVYGDDITTCIELRKKVLADVEMWQKLDAMTEEEAERWAEEGLK